MARTARSTGSAGSKPDDQSCHCRLRTVGHQLRADHTQPLLDIGEPVGRHVRLRWNRRARSDADQVRPRARHHLDQLVAAAAGGDPSATGVLVREAVQGVVRRALAVDGQRQVRERVEDVAVAAVLADEDVRPELLEQRRDDRVERAQPSRVGGARGQRDVDRGALRVGTTGVRGEPGAGEEVAPALVQRDREHPRVVPERALDPVAVVDVDVDVGHPLRALLEQPRDRDGRVVVDAEATARRRASRGADRPRR